MPKKEDDAKLFAFLATFLSIVGFVIALLVKKDNKYVMFYAKQSLIIFIVFMVAMVVGWIPFIGNIISVVVNIAGFIFWNFPTWRRFFPFFRGFSLGMICFIFI